MDKEKLNEIELNEVVGGIEIGRRKDTKVQCCTVCGYIMRRIKGDHRFIPGNKYCIQCKKSVEYDVLTEEEYVRRFGIWKEVTK